MKRLIYFLAPFLIISNAMAWGPEGHRIVAQIAQDQLTGKAKQAISKMLEGEELPEVSNWADTIKSDPAWAHTKPWHFVDIADGEDYDSASHAPGGDAITAITEMVKVLRSPSSTKIDKLSALMFIVHFVGDIHQPLHVGRPDDRGGNSINVLFIGRKMNLHSLWDSGMIGMQRMDYVQYARYLQSQNYLDPAYDLPEIKFSQIVQEDMQLRAQIYNFQNLVDGPIILDEKYMKKNLAGLNERLLIGGKRLALLLNKLFI